MLISAVRELKMRTERFSLLAARAADSDTLRPPVNLPPKAPPVRVHFTMTYSEQ